MRTPGRDFRSALIAAVLAMEERCGALPTMMIGVDLYPALISGDLLGPEFIEELRSGYLIGCKADVVPGDAVLLLEGVDPSTGETIHLRAVLDLDSKRAVFQSDSELTPGDFQQMSADVPESVIRACLVDVVSKLTQLTGATPRIRVGREFVDLCRRGELGDDLRLVAEGLRFLGIQMSVEPIGSQMVIWGVRQGQEVSVSMTIQPGRIIRWDAHGV